MYLQEILFTMYGKDTANDYASLEPSAIYVTELTAFHKKVPSYIFGMVLNTTLSHKLSICYYNTDDELIKNE